MRVSTVGASEALRAGAAAHHGQMSAAIAVLALASGSGSFDAAGSLMVTAEHVQAQVAGLRLFSFWCAGLLIAQCFPFRWPVGWSSSTFRFGALSADGERPADSDSDPECVAKPVHGFGSFAAPAV